MNPAIWILICHVIFAIGFVLGAALSGGKRTRGLR